MDMKRMMFRMVFLGLLLSFSIPLVTTSASSTEKVVEALARPAVLARDPARAVFLDAALAGSRIVAVGERGLVILSDDGGRSWRQAPTPVSVTLTAVRFIDDLHGMAVGHGGAVLSSDDGGEHWVLRFDGRRAAQLALDAAKAEQDNKALSNAEWLVASGPDKPFLDLLMFDTTHALVVGAYGLAFATSDGGKSWQSWMDRFDNPRGLHYNAVRRRGDEIVIAGEQGLVMRSDDAGMHFQRITSPYDGTFFTLELPPVGDIILAGLRGNFWSSQDDGRTWKQYSPPMPVSITGSTILPDGNLLFVNQAGFVLAWSTNNPSFLPINQRPLPVINSILQINDDDVLLLTIQGVLPFHMKETSKVKSQ